MYSTFIKILISAIFVLLLINQKLFAENQDISLVLYSGDVKFIDIQSQKHDPVIGTVFSSNDYQQIELKNESRVYLQYRGKMIHLFKAGKYQVKQLLDQEYSVLSNTLSFLDQLFTPRTYTSRKLARGKQGGFDKKLTDELYFENLWQDIANENESKPSSLKSNDLIASAAWFKKIEKPARVAYILERLDGATGHKILLYQSMRNESLRRITLVQISREVETTRKQTAAKLPVLDYKALLIGIDQYDHPEWQSLKNPIHDIRAIEEVLINDYYFKPNDIVTLKNANFEEIISAFNQLKNKVGENTNLLIYFAGHGYYPEDEGEGYWIPKDAGTTSSQKLFIPTSIVLSKVKAIPAKHTLLIADSCFSGSLVRKTRGTIGQSKYYRELVKKRSRQIITSGGLEPVNDLGGSDHSVFASKFLQLLKNDSTAPVSASELALNLRKEIKNSGEQQTPEYGRLNTLDDENGEFFFIKKGKTIIPEPLIAESEKSGNDELSDDDKKSWLDLGFFSLKFKDNETPNDEENVLAFQSYGQEQWIGVGLDIKNFSIKYQKYNTTESAWEKVQTGFVGTGVKSELRLTNDGLGYGASFYLGRLFASNNEVSYGSDDNDNDDETDHENISGFYTGTGLFIDHTLIFMGSFSLQLGVSAEYHYMTVNNVLGESKVVSTNLSGCININTPYRLEEVTIQPYLTGCSKVDHISGNLENVDNEVAKDVKLKEITSTGVMASFNF